MRMEYLNPYGRVAFRESINIGNTPHIWLAIPFMDWDDESWLMTPMTGDCIVVNPPGGEFLSPIGVCSTDIGEKIYVEGWSNTSIAGIAECLGEDRDFAGSGRKMSIWRRYEEMGWTPDPLPSPDSEEAWWELFPDGDFDSGRNVWPSRPIQDLLEVIGNGARFYANQLGQGVFGERYSVRKKLKPNPHHSRPVPLP